MVSITAKEDIEAMMTAGFNPAVSDIIRLNALGLKIEQSQRPAEELYYLPRVAFLGDVAIYQPTIGHDIWLHEMEAFFDTGDIESAFAITAYACSFADADMLPRKTEEVLKGMCAFKKKLARFTTEQVVSAVRYAVSGTLDSVGEYPERTQKETEEDKEDFDGTPCVSIGVLHSCVAMNMNVSLTEARKLTRSQLENMREIALATSGRVDKKKLKDTLTAEYFATLAAIRERLEKEKVANGN